METDSGTDTHRHAGADLLEETAPLREELVADLLVLRQNGAGVFERYFRALECVLGHVQRLLRLLQRALRLCVCVCV